MTKPDNTTCANVIDLDSYRTADQMRVISLRRRAERLTELAETMRAPLARGVKRENAPSALTAS